MTCHCIILEKLLLRGYKVFILLCLMYTLYTTKTHSHGNKQDWVSYIYMVCNVYIVNIVCIVNYYLNIYVAVEVRKRTLYRKLQLILRKWRLKFSNDFDVIDH